MNRTHHHLPSPSSTILSVLCTALLALVADGARATPCDATEGGLFLGPVGSTTLDGDHAVGRRACPRTEVGIGTALQGTLEPEKYGLDLTIQVASGSPIFIRGAGRVFGSFALSRRLELFASFEPVYARYLISGYQASYIGPGHSTLGATIVAYEDDVIVLSVTQSATLPSAFGLYKNAWPFAFDSGVTMTFAPLDVLHLHGQLSGIASIAYTVANPDPKVGVMALAGGELLLFDWASLVVDLYSVALYRAPLDNVAVQGALRAKIFAGLGVEASLMVPLHGADRNLFVQRLSLAYRF
jgi:hypothetical protein